MKLDRLAIDGGAPVRRQLLPYGRQWLDENDIEAVEEVLRSDWLTTGPAVESFERAFADTVGAQEAVAVSSGTAALHAAMHALDIGPGSEVIVPSMTFAATANCVVYLGGTPVFADVDPGTLLIDPAHAAEKISNLTRAIIAVDYAGQPSDYIALGEITHSHGIAIVADACHALGASSHGRRVGSLARLSAFSFHPVKHVTTGEGGAVTCDDSALAERMRRFRNHGITADHRQREAARSWYYEMVELGFNYRLTDIQCALGLSQLKKLDGWVDRRRQIAREYDDAFVDWEQLEPLRVRSDVDHAYHLYVVALDVDQLRADRDQVYRALRCEGIGVAVHYPPVHLHPFYVERFGTRRGQCPAAEGAAERILSLPICPRMDDEDVESVIAAMQKVLGAYAR